MTATDTRKILEKRVPDHRPTQHKGTPKKSKIMRSIIRTMDRL